MGIKRRNKYRRSDDGNKKKKNYRKKENLEKLKGEGGDANREKKNTKIR